jgi:hypothetical protein
MVTLQLEFRCPDWDAWKARFDADPMDRQGSGVRQHRLLRAADDPSYVIGLLEFDDLDTATAFRAKGREMWQQAEASGLMKDVRVTVLTDVEAATY